MKTNSLIVGVLLACIASACSIPDSSDLIVDESPLKFSSETEYPGTQKTDLFAFVGEKIEVVEFIPPHNEAWFDFAFDAKYRVIEPLFGEFEGNIIEFRAFDHYGEPPFARYSHALLFVSKEEDKLYHEKYIFYAVHKTIDGRWASCGDPYLNMEVHRKPFTPKTLVFKEPVVFNPKDYRAEYIKSVFTEPFFEIQNGKAVCKMGAFVDELVEIQRSTVLKARGVGQ